MINIKMGVFGELDQKKEGDIVLFRKKLYVLSPNESVIVNDFVELGEAISSKVPRIKLRADINGALEEKEQLLINYYYTLDFVNHKLNGTKNEQYNSLFLSTAPTLLRQISIS